MKRMILIDGNSLMYRAYYGTSNGVLMQNSKGLYTNAIYAFANMINSLVKEEYDNILVAFDAGKQTFRHEIMTDYKAGRSPMPDEFRVQIPYIKDYLDRMNISHYELPLYEADDIIGTFMAKAIKEGYHVDIYSSDKDLLQLVSPDSTVHLTKRGTSDLDDYTPEHFKEVFEIEYNQMVDLKAIMGDPSDNLKGIKGIGQKGAVKLLQEYGTLENIIAHKGEIKGKQGELIRESYEDALMCQKMTFINKESPVTITLDDTKYRPRDLYKLKELYTYLEFRGFLGAINKEIALIEQEGLFSEAFTPVFEHEVVKDYTVISNPYDLKDKLLPDSYLIIETDMYNYHKANILCIGLANDKGTFIIEPDLLDLSLDLQMFLADNNNKNTFDLKRAKVCLLKRGITLNGIEYDMMLASYILKPQIKNNDIAICANQFEYNLKYAEEIYGKGAKFKVPEKDILYSYVASKVLAIKNLKKEFIAKLQEYNQYDLLTKVEIPLAHVLAKMEFEGVYIDKDEMNVQRSKYKAEMDSLEQKIWTLAGKEFNIQSPIQLGTVLFEDLGLPASKKTKRGYSTDIDVLNYIKDKHEIVPYIIRYRAVCKIYNTYIEGLDEWIYEDGKIHTIFEQALTVTGRLSSIEPNVQNFPSRTDEGKMIRKFFIPSKKENYLFSADYSQVELRVLAHMADSNKLIDAFNDGRDIHAETAKAVFGVDNVTPELRRRAKAVNFGIVYGISAFGLSEGTDLTPKEAARFIETYFSIYPEIKEYMDKTVEFAKENGYVLTLLNRRRYIPELKSAVYMQREFGKRTAMNAPIQGSAADIIKMAMINIDKKFSELKLKSKMVIQIHDELVFEVMPDEKEMVERIVVSEMENAIKLKVRLDVDFGFGANLMEVH